jgi:transcriptional regulator with GAF, ATPase, and Fis domain
MSDTQELRIAAPDAVSSRAVPSTVPPGLTALPYQVARLQALESFDRLYLQEVLRRAQGNVTHAARLAGKERRALGKLLRKRRINTAPFRT